jgi:hypothetical protein
MYYISNNFEKSSQLKMYFSPLSWESTYTGLPGRPGVC